MFRNSLAIIILLLICNGKLYEAKPFINLIKRDPWIKHGKIQNRSINSTPDYKENQEVNYHIFFLNYLNYLFTVSWGPSINDVFHFLRFLTSPSPLSPILQNSLVEYCHLLADPPPP